METKRFLSVLLTLVMVIGLLSSFTLTAVAEETSGNCGANGDNITWAYDADTKTLTFSGTGETEAYDTENIREWNAYIPDIENIIIGHGITRIRTGFASHHPKLKNIVISETVESLGVSAFSGCDSLVEVYIPGNVKTIASMAFVQCDSLSKVHIAEGVKVIESRAFQMCNNIKTINIPDSVESVGDLSFAYCEGLETALVGSGVTSINTSAFKKSEKLSAVYINCTSEQWSKKGLGTAFFPTTTNIYYTDTNGIVRFDACGGYSDKLFASVNAENKIENLPTPTKAYAVFEGWYDDEKAGNKITTDTVFNSATTVFAHWNSQAKITFDTNGGVCDTLYVYADKNGKLSSLPKVTKEKCTFEGWYDAKVNGTKITTDTVFSEDITVYAYWSVQQNYETEWIGYCRTANKAYIYMDKFLPSDADITSVQAGIPYIVGERQTLTYSSNISSSYALLYTKALENPASETYAIVVNTSNYGAVTIEATINLIDFEIESYNAIENIASMDIPLAGTYTVVFADYDGDRLSNVETREITITEPSNVPVSITKGFTLGTDDKIMLWNNLSDFVPLCEVYIVK